MKAQLTLLACALAVRQCRWSAPGQSPITLFVGWREAGQGATRCDYTSIALHLPASSATLAQQLGEALTAH